MQKVKTAGLATVLVMIVIGMTPLVLAGDPGEASGEATGGNVAPEVTSVTAPSPVDPQAESVFSCTVQDNNTLEDITTVELIVYLTAEVNPDNIMDHYTFRYTADGMLWEEIGPDSTTDSHIVVANCNKPSNLTVPSGDYSFAIILSGAATAGEWTAIWIATDDDVASGDNTGTFTVTEYISLAILPTTQTFSGNPGETGLPAAEGPITCTVTANINFDIETGLATDWIGTTYSGTIGAGNTHADNSAGPIDLSSTENKTVWYNVTFDEDVARDITYTLDLPSPLRDDVYTTTFYVQAVATT